MQSGPVVWPVLFGRLDCRVTHMEGMRKTRVTTKSSDPQNLRRRVLSAGIAHTFLHLSCLLPRAQKVVIKESIVAERIQPTGLKERKWKVDMRALQNGRHLWTREGSSVDLFHE